MDNRRDFLKFGGLCTIAQWGVAGAANKLPNSALHADQTKVDKQPFGELRIYYDGPTDQLKAMTAGSLLLKVGMSPHPPHEHPEEEIMVIAEGEGEISVEGKLSKVGPGSMMYCAANHLHGIVNTGKTPLLFYFYKWKA